MQQDSIGAELTFFEVINSLEDINILLATYNGGRFLVPLLESLLKQSHVKFKLLVSDDGSSDDTNLILSNYEKSYPERIQRLPFRSCHGACANFAYLMQSTTADYVFLADQDDVWDADKMIFTLSAMLELENVYGKGTPLLVHTDLRVVDKDLNLISTSFLRFMRLRSDRFGFNDLLLQNAITGCALLANRALIERALPIPSAAAMHDWWLGLVASAFGTVVFLNRPTIAYRQHDSNTVGATGWSFSLIFSKLNQLVNRQAAGKLLQPSLSQADFFLQAYATQLPSNYLSQVSKFVALRNQNGLSRAFAALCLGCRKHGFLRTIAFYWALLIAKLDA